MTSPPIFSIILSHVIDSDGVEVDMAAAVGVAKKLGVHFGNTRRFGRVKVRVLINLSSICEEAMIIIMLYSKT